MKMEDVEKDITPVSSNKRESFLGSYISFPWGYRGKKHDSLLSTFRNNLSLIISNIIWYLILNKKCK